MGYTPAQVEAMSLYQFDACARGWQAVHGGGGSAGLNDAEFDELSNMLDGVSG